MNNIKSAVQKETDYLIVGAGAMGMAFADEIFTLKPKLKITIVDRRAHAGGHWNDAYPFVRLHQPAAFYGVNSRELSNGNHDLSSKSELLEYYAQVISKFIKSKRVEVLFEHNYLGNGQLEDLNNKSNITTYKINKRLVDASYMNVEVPATHIPKYDVDAGVPLVPLNDLNTEYDKWNNFYVIGNGKTGMDAVLFLLDKGISQNNIYWISPNQAWLFNRKSLQVGVVAKEILNHAEALKHAKKADDIFLKMEKLGGIVRIDESTLPKKWRCATISDEELLKLRTIENVIDKGRVRKITSTQIMLQEGSIDHTGKPLFVDCSANGLSKRVPTPIFSKDKLTLQSILFCQQVFSAATIARLELTKLSEKRKNRIVPVPHPEMKEDWPSALSVGLLNYLSLQRILPIWMFRSRLNFMSHEPFINFLSAGAKAIYLSPTLKKVVNRNHQVNI